jgi:hypothetical protein
MEESTLAAGMYFDRPREGAPDFVKGRLSFKVADAIPFLEKYKNEKGYVNVDLLKSKEGKLYLKLNNWKPEPKTEPTEQTKPDYPQPEGDVPF